MFPSLARLANICQGWQVFADKFVKLSQRVTHTKSLQPSLLKTSALPHILFPTKP